MPVLIFQLNAVLQSVVHAAKPVISDEGQSNFSCVYDMQQSAYLGRNWSDWGSQMSMSIPLMIPKNLFMWGATEGCPLTSAA